MKSMVLGEFITDAMHGCVGEGGMLFGSRMHKRLLFVAVFVGLCLGHFGDGIVGHGLMHHRFCPHFRGRVMWFGGEYTCGG